MKLISYLQVGLERHRKRRYVVLLYILIFKNQGQIFTRPPLQMAFLPLRL